MDFTLTIDCCKVMQKVPPQNRKVIAFYYGSAERTIVSVDFGCGHAVRDISPPIRL